MLLALGLPIFSYLTLIYRELGRMTTGRIHEHLEIFEAEIEPKLKIARRSGGRTFQSLGEFFGIRHLRHVLRSVSVCLINKDLDSRRFPGDLSLDFVLVD